MYKKHIKTVINILREYNNTPSLYRPLVNINHTREREREREMTQTEMESGEGYTSMTSIGEFLELADSNSWSGLFFFDLSKTGSSCS